MPEAPDVCYVMLHAPSLSVSTSLFSQVINFMVLKLISVILNQLACCSLCFSCKIISTVIFLWNIQVWGDTTNRLYEYSSFSCLQTMIMISKLEFMRKVKWWHKNRWSQLTRKHGMWSPEMKRKEEGNCQMCCLLRHLAGLLFVVTQWGWGPYLTLNCPSPIGWVGSCGTGAQESWSSTPRMSLTIFFL